MAARILITGAGGQLGREFVATLTGSDRREAPDVIAMDRGACDLVSRHAVRAAIEAASPAILINCAAYTDVNGAESNPQAAYAVNAAAPGVLAEECARTGALLVHFSTDYVFDGASQQAYGEEDRTRPLNIYGASKLAGEQAIASSCCRHFIFRTSWVYSAHGRNFVRTMLALGREKETLRVIDDQVGAPTSTGQLVDAVTRVLAEQPDAASGIYHLTAAGTVSWCGLARRIFEQVGSQTEFAVREVIAVRSSEFPSPAVRPLNSRLSNQKFRAAFGFEPGAWQEALDRVLAELGVLKEEHVAQ